MTDHTVSSISASPAKQLLAEFTAVGESDGNRQLLNQVTEAVQGLGLQPVQRERIQQALSATFAREVQKKEVAAFYGLRIRIWVVRVDAPCHGWGFFLVEKDSNARGGSPPAEHLVELFLYQECDS
jgi:hypothetical protein